ncbi:MAG TPA: rod shape-determining protein RodA [Cyanobacteria bacterium UBA11149]|nr:rod shape-determining protein RodA [Cyanobacteria bacterium UBA11367]HBE59187.1 rod shape-determining protein RodA [Cyanobacteria bacterium UBA11366]HBK62599.1 rod shape-determining protein RodA [Cyanobacteria bacterium UBA11166]HBR72528.1 rod shape-determining protein RodA [Cyanobacteria bacterium UBA11159]HBS69485.1 rod shape-determining protein RodA [Cyanobacteria bacterium UBA11153]HBW89237.1 rod shape-determining protein RodA [Cyanobacteria bacterium UBA11149]HCA97875.1 rod shape-dete
MFQRSLNRSSIGIRWQSILMPLQALDWQLLILTIGLTALGGVMIRSAELNAGLTDWWWHWVIGGIGLTLALTIARSRYEALLQLHWIIYAITNISLVAVMLIGSAANGAQRWINIFGFNVQPSEFAKIGLIITLAAILHAKPASTLGAMFRVLGVAAVPWIFVFLEPNLGTSLVFGSITFGMLYWANANPGWLILMASPVVSAILYNVFFPAWVVWLAVIVFIGWRCLPWPLLGGIGALIVNTGSGFLGHVLWGLLKDYQKARLILFLDPDKDPLGGGYHLIQSRIAIGSGQLWGRGLNQGTQTQLHFIPEQHTDFIFSAIGEELGFIGCLCVLIVFWLICLRLVIIAQNAKDNFGSLLAIGLLSMIVFQTVVNIGMNIGVAPITGIPLPLLSYGRSALLANFIGIGLVESVANHRHRLKF